MPQRSGFLQHPTLTQHGTVKEKQMAYRENHSSTAGAPVTRISAILLILVGLGAIFLPGLAGIGISILFGVAVLLGGVVYALFAFAARGTGTFVWRVLVSIAFLCAGLYLLMNPLISLVTLTFIVALVFLIEGLAELASYVALRALPGSGVILLNALFSFVLAFLLWRSWPSSSTWAIGTLVGINLITTGVTRLMFAPTTKT